MFWDQQAKRAASTQKRFATLAHEEARYHEGQARRDFSQHNTLLENFHEQEAGISEGFSVERRMDAAAYRAQIPAVGGTNYAANLVRRLSGK